MSDPAVFTAIIHKHNGNNVQADYNREVEWLEAMEKHEDKVKWSRLYRAVDGEEIMCIGCE